jgi:hypothetical protein
VLVLLLVVPTVHADAPAGDAETAVRATDAAFWKAYNTCDIAAFGDYFSADIEFYHDKGGMTKSRAALVDSLKKNICGNPNQRIRREAITDTVQFYPMAGNRAILSGDHRFYITEPGKPEYLTGQAKFDDLWELQDGHWRMTRVFSYAHGPVPYTPPAAIALSAAALAKFAGHYVSKQSGAIDIVVVDTHLKMTSGSLILAFFALSPTQFFVKERDLRFEFSARDDRAADGFIVRENGNVVDEARRSTQTSK